MCFKFKRGFRKAVAVLLVAFMFVGIFPFSLSATPFVENDDHPEEAKSSTADYRNSDAGQDEFEEDCRSSDISEDEPLDDDQEPLCNDQHDGDESGANTSEETGLDDDSLASNQATAETFSEIPEGVTREGVTIKANTAVENGNDHDVIIVVDGIDEGNGDRVYTSWSSGSGFNEEILMMRNYGSYSVYVRVWLERLNDYVDFPDPFEGTITAVPPILENIKIEPTPSAPVYRIGSYNWYKGPVTISVDGWYIIKGKPAPGETGWSNSLVVDDEGVYNKLSVSFKNDVDQITGLIDLPPFALDLTDPKIKRIELKDINTDINPGGISRVLGIFPFGLFFNQSIEVTVYASDNPHPDAVGARSSGIKAIKLFTYAADGAKREVEYDSDYDLADGIATFVIDAPFKGTLKVEVIDNVDRSSKKQLVTSANSNMKDVKGFVMLETDDPNVDIDYDPPVHTSEGKGWYQDDVLFTVTAQDVGSGINSVKIWINGKLIIDTDYSAEENRIFEKEFKVSTAQGDRIEDDPEDDLYGSYTLRVKVVDNAGNVVDREEVVYKDIDSPYIYRFEFAARGHRDADVEGDTNVVVQELEYGYYFSEDTTVTIIAKDDIGPSAGIKSITWQTVDIDAGIVLEGTELVDKDRISVLIPANFRGQIYASVTDNMGWEPTDFVTPAGIIVEASGSHRNHSQINIARPATSFTDSAGLPLYAGDTNIGLVVVDNHSGIRQITWSVTSPYDTPSNQSGTVGVTNSGSLTGSTVGWEITGTDRNLVTEMRNTLTVRNNSNTITVSVTITDRAGNGFTESIIFSIDKTFPTIEVTYDNNSPDREFTDYYNADRVATIVITERNFRASDVSIRITNEAQNENIVPTVSSWETVRTANPDNSTHTATVRYSADGNYTFSINYSDNANNPAASRPQDRFTIDQTAPVISVAYDNNTAQNGNYFNTDRIATITITELNFDSSRVEITGSATHLERTVAFPTLSEWSSNGDVHTATLHFTSDALYAYVVLYTDMAGNSAEPFVAEAFFIDKTGPALRGAGADQHGRTSVYRMPVNEEPPVVLEFEDVNFSHIIYDVMAYSYIGRGEDGGIAMFEVAPIEGLQNETTNTSIRLPSVFFDEDGIYEIRATAYDLAGNNSGEMLHTYVVMRDVTMMAYIPVHILSDFNGKPTQAVNFKDIQVSVYTVENQAFDILIGDTLLVNGDGYTTTLEAIVNGVTKHVVMIQGSFIARTFNADDQVYNLPINVSKNPIRTVGRLVINNVKPVGIFGSDLRNDMGYYGVPEQEIQIIRLSDGIDVTTTTIRVDGIDIPIKSYDPDTQIMTFMLDKSQSHGHPWTGYTIEVMLVDTAGNEFPMEVVTNVYVGSWVGRYWIIITLGGVILLGGAALVIIKLKKRVED